VAKLLDRRSAPAIGHRRTWRPALSLLRRSVGAFAAELAARCAINHLRLLDDDRLRELGLEREDVERFVRSGRD
jgi:hypothetical protein